MPQKQLKFLSFWSINDGAELQSLRTQLHDLKAHGMEGVVFHPRFYPGNPDYMTPEFLHVVSELILYAKEIGMEFWLYDENGWPSGSADGQVLKRHPESVRQGIAMVWDDEVLPEDERLCSHDGKTVVCRSMTGISPLCKETTETFLQLTHERYRQELAPEAFDYVTGFFCDEVDYFSFHLLSEGGVPWCADFERFYEEKHHEPLREQLWKLFTEGGCYPDFKVRFWETAADLIAENFYRPYQAWCEKHGKLFTGHLKGEESPYFQLMFSGSCFTQLKNLSLPAIDALERYPGNHFYPYLLSSVAQQQGRSGCLAEAMGGAGWGVGPGDLTRYALWLAEAGIDRMVLHLAQYRLIANAIRDWPPSVPLHLTWHGAYAEVLQTIRKAAQPLLNAAWETEKTLIVTPTRGIMAAYDPHDTPAINLHDGTGIPENAAQKINADFLKLVETCYDAGMAYHFTQEREFEQARIRNGRIWIGEMSYGSVIIPEGCRLDGPAKELADPLKEQGLLISAPYAEAAHRAATAPKISQRADGAVPQQTDWTIFPPEENQMLLECAVSGDRLTAVLQNQGASGPASLFFSDPVRSVRINGKEITGTPDRMEFTLPDDEKIVIEIVTGAEKQPFVWIRGRFAVVADGGFTVFDDKHRSCRGSFALAPLDGLRPGDLIAQGLPFFGGLLRAQKTIRVDREIDAALSFKGFRAAAARICVDGREIGWWWPEHPVRLRLAAGEHTVLAEAAPSTFNGYGPHRYYQGDGRLVSPVTFTGEKSFSDDPDAPSCTLIDTMQFVRFEIDGDIMMLDEN